jgi:hypothetical protein
MCQIPQCTKSYRGVTFPDENLNGAKRLSARERLLLVFATVLAGDVAVLHIYEVAGYRVTCQETLVILADNYKPSTGFVLDFNWTD